jgi:hypothetical protein
MGKSSMKKNTRNYSPYDGQMATPLSQNVSCVNIFELGTFNNMHFRIEEFGNTGTTSTPFSDSLLINNFLKRKHPSTSTRRLPFDRNTGHIEDGPQPVMKARKLFHDISTRNTESDISKLFEDRRKTVDQATSVDLSRTPHTLTPTDEV